MRPLLLAAPLLFVAVSVSAQIFPRRTRPEPVEAPLPDDVPECMTVRAEARPDGVAFTHVVVVENHCSTTVRCRISTDVDPTPEHAVVLRAGRSEDVVTRNSSVAPGVRARAVCRQDAVPSAGRR